MVVAVRVPEDLAAAVPVLMDLGRGRRGHSGPMVRAALIQKDSIRGRVGSAAVDVVRAGSDGEVPAVDRLSGIPGIRGQAVMQKLAELQTTLADPNATVEQLKEKMTAVRSARQKAKVDLAAARKDLLQLLTLDQEATLVSLDYLD